MMRLITCGLVIIPLALMLINFLGYAYAHQVKPLCAFRNPYVAVTIESKPLLGSYWAYLQDVLNSNIQSISDPWRSYGELPMGQVVFDAAWWREGQSQHGK